MCISTSKIDDLEAVYFICRELIIYCRQEKTTCYGGLISLLDLFKQAFLFLLEIFIIFVLTIFVIVLLTRE